MLRYFLILLVIVTSIIILSVYRTELSPIDIEPANIGKFGGVSLRIEYATTEIERERGLGGRESIPNDYGMLFVFPKDDVYGIWMKDTLVPLDIFWLDAQGQVVSMKMD